MYQNKNNIMKQAVKESKTSLSIEGINMSPEIEDLITKRLSGILTEQEFKKRVEKIIGDLNG